MIAEQIKLTVDTMSATERHELSTYLTKLELQNDADYWETVRRRAENNDPSAWVNIDDL